MYEFMSEDELQWYQKQADIRERRTSVFDEEPGVPIKVKKLHDDAVIPQYAKPGDAGFDLVATEDVTIRPGQTRLIPTGLALAIPVGYEIQVRPRSGLSYRTKMRVANSPGTIDAGFRGELKVIAENIGAQGVYKTIEIKKGDRIAQGVLAIAPLARFIEVDELDDTERGTGGFGHTGVNS